eukprot:743977-Pyramimonas_sp.AAC.2
MRPVKSVGSGIQGLGILSTSCDVRFAISSLHPAVCEQMVVGWLEDPRAHLCCSSCLQVKRLATRGQRMA